MSMSDTWHLLINYAVCYDLFCVVITVYWSKSRVDDEHAMAVLKHRPDLANLTLTKVHDAYWSAIEIYR